MNYNKLIIIADSHIGLKEGDLAHMFEFINNLNPKQDEILFLGDLFHIWAGPTKYHTEEVRSLMNRLREYQLAGGSTHLITGNRDVFFNENKDNTKDQGLPFNSISCNSKIIHFQNKKLLLLHGDTVNTKDIQYLKWRKTVRSRWFRFPFNLMPSFYVKRIMFSLEEKLKCSNTEFRQDFPRREWERFLDTTAEDNPPDLVIIGHFHPEEPIVTNRSKLTGIVLPDWLENRIYLTLDKQMNYSFKRFSNLTS